MLLRLGSAPSSISLLPFVKADTVENSVHRMLPLRRLSLVLSRQNLVNLPPPFWAWPLPRLRSCALAACGLVFHSKCFRCSARFASPTSSLLAHHSRFFVPSCATPIHAPCFIILPPALIHHLSHTLFLLHLSSAVDRITLLFLYWLLSFMQSSLLRSDLVPITGPHFETIKA
jgi:hypothetical protein